MKLKKVKADTEETPSPTVPPQAEIIEADLYKRTYFGPDIPTLELECWEEELSEAQLKKYKNADDEYKSIQNKLDDMVKDTGGQVVYNGDQFTAYQLLGNEKRGPRTRGMRRNRGVRIRGGRGGRAMVEVLEVVPADGDGCGTWSGGPVKAQHERPCPLSFDQGTTCEITAQPEDQGHENALHSRKRKWQRSDHATLHHLPPSSSKVQPALAVTIVPPAPSSSVAPLRPSSSEAPAALSSLVALPIPSLSEAPTAPFSLVALPIRTPSEAPPAPSSLVSLPIPSLSEASPAPPPSMAPPIPSLSDSLPAPPPSMAPPIPSLSVTSPGMFVDFLDDEDDSDSSSESENFLGIFQPRRRDRRIRNNDLLNFGSDEDSGGSDAESSMPLLPRVLRNEMETPLEMDVEDSPPITHCREDATHEDAPSEADGIQAIYEPSNLYDFKWREFPDPPIDNRSRRETFSVSNVGPTAPSADPYSIFTAIWDRQFMENIAVETNRYAQQVAAQKMHSNTLYPRSRISRWYDTTADELYVYFAIILAMGVVVKARIEDYWATATDIFRTPGFSAHLSIDRYYNLNKCLHFSNNEEMGALKLDYSEARLFKIQPILSHLNNKFKELYIPSQNIALDESLLMWKGWLEFNQRIPNKAAHRGIKTYEICESQTGYLWRFEVHTAKKLPLQNFEDPMEASTPAIVMRLVKGCIC